jgi:hypothetical protein
MEYPNGNLPPAYRFHDSTTTYSSRRWAKYLPSGLRCAVSKATRRPRVIFMMECTLTIWARLRYSSLDLPQAQIAPVTKQ